VEAYRLVISIIPEAGSILEVIASDVFRAAGFLAHIVS
jgi:hypothetical protein